MSDFKFRYVKEIPADMPDPAHRVLIAIWNHTNEAGLEAFPGVDTLAAETGKSRATVLRWMKWLRDSGWIVQERRGGRSGDGRTWSSAYSLGHGTIPGQLQPVNLDEQKTASYAPDANPDPLTLAEDVRPTEGYTDTIAVPSVSGSEWAIAEEAEPEAPVSATVPTCAACNESIFGTPQPGHGGEVYHAKCLGKRIYESRRHAPQPVESVSF